MTEDAKEVCCAPPLGMLLTAYLRPTPWLILPTHNQIGRPLSTSVLKVMSAALSHMYRMYLPLCTEEERSEERLCARLLDDPALSGRFKFFKVTFRNARLGAKCVCSVL